MEGPSSSDRYTERCALAAELAQVLETARQLEAHMGVKGGADDGGERCRALVSSLRYSVDRSIQMAMASCCAPGAPESPPSAEGSPRSGGSDQAADSRCRGGANAAGQCKKRKTLPRWSTQVRVNSVQDVGPLDDGFSWRKYGQKDILGAKYPRAYFRCTYRHSQSCHASKQVQRADGDPLLFDVVYHGNHTCAQGNSQRPRHAASGEHWQPQPQPAGGQERVSIISVGLKAEGVAMGLETPFSFQAKPAGAADTATGSAASSDFLAGCALTTSPFVSPATSECQFVRSVPDVELTSMTDSQMADMDEFMLQLADADFLDNSHYF